MTNCKNCNAILVDLFNFCPYCGELTDQGQKRRAASQHEYEKLRSDRQRDRERVLADTLNKLGQKWRNEHETIIRNHYDETIRQERIWRINQELIMCPRVFIVPELPPCDHKDCNLDAVFSVLNPHEHPIDKTFYCEKHALDLLLGSAAIGDDTAAKTMTRLVLGTEL